MDRHNLQVLSFPPRQPPRGHFLVSLEKIYVGKYIQSPFQNINSNTHSVCSILFFSINY